MSDKPVIPRAEVADLLCVFCCDFVNEAKRLKCGHKCCRTCGELRAAHALGVLLTDNPPDEIASNYPKPVFCPRCPGKDNGITEGAALEDDPETQTALNEFKARHGIPEDENISVSRFDFSQEDPICTPHKAHGVAYDFDTHQVVCEQCLREGEFRSTMPLKEAMVEIRKRCDDAVAKCKVFVEQVNRFEVVDFEELKARKKKEIHDEFERLHALLREQEAALRDKIKKDRVSLEEDYKRVKSAVATLKDELRVSIEAMRRAEATQNAEWIAGINARAIALNKEVGEMFQTLLSREYKIELVKLVDLEKEIVFEVKKPEFGRRVTDPTLIKKYLITYYQTLADQGDKWGQYMYGMCLLEGQGVSKNVELAKQFISKSAQQEYGPAKKALKEIKS